MGLFDRLWKKGTEPKKLGPQERLAMLSKEQLLSKLADLPWIETRTGIPGVAINKLTPEQHLLLTDADHVGLTELLTSGSLGGRGFYTYNPELIQRIQKKEGFAQEGEGHDTRQWNRSIVIELLPKVTVMLNQHGETALKGEKLPKVITIPHPYGDKIGAAGEQFRNIDPTLHIDYIATSHDPDKGIKYDVRLHATSIGKAIIGQMYLYNRTQEQDKGPQRQ